jgi:membrane protease YdiL (CAAX protease family)
MEEKTVSSPLLKPPGGFSKVWYILYPILIYFGITFAVALIAMLVFSFSLAAEYPFTGGDLMAYSTDLGSKVTELVNANTLLIQTISYFLIAGLFLLLFIRDIKKRGLYKDKCEKTGILPYILMALSVGAFSLFFVTFANITKIYEIFPSMLANDTLITGQNPILVFIMISIITPICEELFFRGMLFKRLRGMMSFVPAAIISALFFGLAHVSPPQIIYTGILGFLFAYVYEKYGSILVPMFCHFALNTVIFITNYTVAQYLEDGTVIMVTFIVSGVIFIACLIPLRLRLKKMPAMLHKMPQPEPVIIPEYQQPAPPTADNNA